MPPFTGTRDPIPAGSVDRSDLALPVGRMILATWDGSGGGGAELTWGEIEGTNPAIPFDTFVTVELDENSGAWVATTPISNDDLPSYIGLWFDGLGFYPTDADGAELPGGLFTVDFVAQYSTDPTGRLSAYIEADHDTPAGWSVPTHVLMVESGLPSYAGVSRTVHVMGGGYQDGFRCRVQGSTIHTNGDGATAVDYASCTISRAG